MWPLIRSDISYHRNTFIMLFIMVSAFFIFLQFSPEKIDFMIFVLVFVIVNQINTYRIREKRDRQHTLLPLSARQIGMARLLVLLLPCAAAFMFYYLLGLIFTSGEAIESWKLVVLFGLTLLFFSVFLILQDIYYMFPRSRLMGLFGQSTHLMVFAIGMLVFMSLGLFAFMSMEKTGQPPAALVYTIDFAKKYNPFGGTFGIVRFLIFSLAFSYLSVLTFSRRKSFVE
jgi:hypothetical protein